MTTFLMIFVAAFAPIAIYSIAKTFSIRKELNAILSDGTLDIPSVANAALPLSSHTTFSLEDLARFEKRVGGLTMIVLVAHTIERPRDLLRDAVEANLLKGVKYLFLVSPSSLAGSAPVFFQDFLTSAKFVKEKYRIERPVGEMVEVASLEFEWEDYPYVFYRLKDGPPSGPIANTFAFRGTKMRAGLAEYYEPVPAAFAQTLVRSVLAKITTQLRSSVGDFPLDQFADPRQALRIIKPGPGDRENERAAN